MPPCPLHVNPQATINCHICIRERTFFHLCAPAFHIAIYVCIASNQGCPLPDTHWADVPVGYRQLNCPNRPSHTKAPSITSTTQPRGGRLNLDLNFDKRKGRPSPLRLFMRGRSQEQNSSLIPLPQLPETPRSAPPLVSTFNHRPSRFSQPLPTSQHEVRPAVPQRARSERRLTFEDGSDVHLFAQALLGVNHDHFSYDLETTYPRSATTPRPAPAPWDTSPPQTSIGSPSPHFDTSLPRRGSHSDLYSAPISDFNLSFLGQDSHDDLYSDPSPVEEQRTPSNWFTEAILRLPEEEPSDVDELPDYAQSQREAAAEARKGALRRAAELERQWVASSHRRQ